MPHLKKIFKRRVYRNRSRLAKNNKGRLRLSVFRSNSHIYAQVIDDDKGLTVASASSVDKGLRSKLNTGGDLSAANEVGRLIAERAIASGIKDVVFDRGGCRYHGRIKALADAARNGGLAF